MYTHGTVHVQYMYTYMYMYCTCIFAQFVHGIIHCTCTCSSVLTLPREEEDDTPITGGWVQQAHGLGAVVAGQHDVQTSTRHNESAGLRVVQVPYSVHERTCGCV